MRSLRQLLACLAVLFVFALAAESHAQPKKAGPVAGLVTKGRELFDEQRYEESIQTLSGALVRDSASDAERITVLQLLAYNYITLGRLEEADSFVRALYVIDEGFTLGPKESPRFREFFEKSKAQWEADGKPGKKVEEGPAEAEKPIRLMHAPVAQVEPGNPIKIEGKVDDAGNKVKKVALFVRTGASGKFDEKELIFSMGAFRGQIAPALVTPPSVDYYVLALDEAGIPLASRGDADTPLRVIVPEESTSVVESPWFWIPIGAVVVAGAILTGVLVGTSGDDPPPNTPTSTIRISIGE